MKMSEPESKPPQPIAGPSQSYVVPPNPRPILMPETFTGTGREWSDWAAQFEMAADVNNWNESLSLQFMSLLLSG